MTIDDALGWGSGVLESGKVTEPGNDCELLLAHAVRKDRSWVFLNRGRPIPAGALDEFRSMVFGRASGTPVRYLTRSVEFFGLALGIRRGVYIPKWETELLVEEALGYLGVPRRSDLTWGRSRNWAVVHEIGTGSGAIAVAIAKHASGANVWASDVSAFAISLARANAESIGVLKQIHFCRGDMQFPLAGIPDLVVANLPYISEGIDCQLPREVRAQPRSSLLSRSSGLGHIERLLKTLKVKPGGRVLLEIASDQAKDVRALCADEQELVYERTVRDLAGLDRVAVIAAV